MTPQNLEYVTRPGPQLGVLELNETQVSPHLMITFYFSSHTWPVVCCFLIPSCHVPRLTNLPLWIAD